MRVQVQRQVLSDKSEVFNVAVYQNSTEPGLILPAVSERNAHELADSLVQLIPLHTNEHVWH